MAAADIGAVDDQAAAQADAEVKIKEGIDLEAGAEGHFADGRGRGVVFTHDRQVGRTGEQALHGRAAPIGIEVGGLALGEVLGHRQADADEVAPGALQASMAGREDAFDVGGRGVADVVADRVADRAAEVQHDEGDVVAVDIHADRKGGVGVDRQQ